MQGARLESTQLQLSSATAELAGRGEELRGSRHDLRLAKEALEELGLVREGGW